MSSTQYIALKKGHRSSRGNVTFLNERANRILFFSNSGAACGTVDPLKKYISTAIGDATFICYNNIIYYLVGASGLVGDCQATGGLPMDLTQCPQEIAPSLLKLPGEDELDGTQWGGITKDDFIIGYVVTLKSLF